MTANNFIIISNRLPIQLEKRDGKWFCEPTSGGLVSALAGIQNELQFRWVGWPGTSVPPEDQEEVRSLLRDRFRYEPVFLTDEEVDRFYNGFSNSVLWPLFHYLPNHVDFSLPYWDVYRSVNARFADTVHSIANGSASVWVHDYHLFLLPALLRERSAAYRIGFFLHIPFPESEVYRLLPVRREILQGVLGSDLIGFHTHDYSRYFTRSCQRILGAEWEPGRIRWDKRHVAIGAYPIGINSKLFLETLKKPEAEQKREQLSKTYDGVKLILGVDRNDYIKGLPHKLRAFERFLEQHPEWHKKVILLQIVIPSRTNVRDYQNLKNEIDQLVGRINGRFGTTEFSPIQYVAREVAFDELCALYERADILMVTSIRDGMNLVSLEYVACQRKRHGVLILSEFAGVARSLGGALFVNPWDAQGTGDAIHQALTMDDVGRARRALENFTYVRTFHSLAWARRFLKDLESGQAMAANPPEDLQAEFLRLKREYVHATKRLIFLDYDGTLVPFAPNSAGAEPSVELVSVLSTLCKKKGNLVCLISGRTMEDLERWFGTLPIGLAAEYGFFIRTASSKEWIQRRNITTEWMKIVEPILQDHVRRTPGSRLEFKKSSLVWHFREAEEKFGEWQALELMMHLEETLSNKPVTVFQGNKAVEIRPQEIDKGALVREMLVANTEPNPFILSIGDDRTDEDMFAALPLSAWTCRVGKDMPTCARYFLEAPAEVVEILSDLSRIS